MDDKNKNKEQLTQEISNLRQKLKESEERFSKAFTTNLVPMGVFLFPDGKCINVNESFLQITGYSYEDAIGKKAADLFVNPEEYSRLLEFMKINQKFYNQEMKFYKKSGEQRIALGSAEMVELDGKQCILGVMMDITDKKIMEKEISRLESLNLIGEMAASIGHEVRNPMTVVRGFLQMIKDKPEVIKYQNYFELMIDELDRANLIIKEFLYLSKNKIIERVKQNLNKIISNITELIKAEATISDKRINLELGNIPDLLVDEREIHQLILNLVFNGLDATPSGGKVTIKTYSDNGYVVMLIQDEGMGIHPSILDKLGTPFVTTKENGTGLGLAVCYSIAARHKATIDVETGPTGTSFYLRFMS